MESHVHARHSHLADIQDSFVDHRGLNAESDQLPGALRICSSLNFELVLQVHADAWQMAP